MQTMTFSASAFETYKRTVALHEPETGGALIGRPEKPFFIEEFRFCPSSRNEDGTYNSGLTHFGIDADYVNWAIDHEWGPNGRYVLGFLHSHPHGVTRLSGGDMNGVAGDIPLLTACLEAPEMKAAGVHQLLAPIATFRADGSDQLHGWMLKRGSSSPEKVDIVIEEEPVFVADSEGGKAFDPLANVDADLIDCLVRRRRASLDTPGFHRSDRALVRRLYDQVIKREFPAQTPLRSNLGISQIFAK